MKLLFTFADFCTFPFSVHVFPSSCASLAPCPLTFCETKEAGTTAEDFRAARLQTGRVFFVFCGNAHVHMQVRGIIRSADGSNRWRGSGKCGHGVAAQRVCVSGDESESR